MPKKSKTSKNDIKQKQTQKQIVNVNINQTKKTTTKRKPRENNKPPQKQIIYQHGEPSLGRPSDNLLYNRPPVIAQVIPAMGGDTNALMPPNNTSIETILKTMKDKTDRIMRPTKKLVDSGTQEIFNMEPKKKFELKPETLTTTAPRGTKILMPKQPFKLTGEIVQRKNTDMQTEAPKRKTLTDSGSSTLYTQEPKTVSSVSTEVNVKTPNFKEMIDASKKIKAAVKSKLYSDNLKEYIPKIKAGEKILSAIQSKQYSDRIKQYKAVNNVLGPIIKQSRVRNKYITKRDKYLDKKEENKLNTLEAQTDYIENVVKKADDIMKKKETDKMIQNSIKNNAALNLQRVIRGHKSRKDTENEKMKPVELFGGTRAGTDIHPEPTAPPQPLFGQNLKITMRKNYDEIKKILDIEPKSYQEVLDAKKKINVYKQNIKRIKIRKNAKSILSDEEMALKKDVLDEIKQMQQTYDKIYKEFYKTQQPKRGRKAKD
jgi:hypothetical protein